MGSMAPRCYQRPDSFYPSSQPSRLRLMSGGDVQDSSFTFNALSPTCVPAFPLSEMLSFFLSIYIRRRKWRQWHGLHLHLPQLYAQVTLLAILSLANLFKIVTHTHTKLSCVIILLSNCCNTINITSCLLFHPTRLYTSKAGIFVHFIHYCIASSNNTI